MKHKTPIRRLDRDLTPWEEALVEAAYSQGYSSGDADGMACANDCTPTSGGRNNEEIIDEALGVANPAPTLTRHEAADIAQEVAHKYEASAMQDPDGERYWRAKAEVAREIEKRLRGEP